ncbi:hypothetical protein R1sor_018097 [Riccia sorocarpa]|uniref:LysM domain-containing protein n=1 Tax=Riccia sorocarpa TaxID=122646 RepID=A0ABD3ICA5_9MARC
MSAPGKGVPKSGKDDTNKTISQLIGAVTASGIAWSLYKSFQGRPADKVAVYPEFDNQYSADLVHYEAATKAEGTLVPSESRPRLEKNYEILKGDTLWEISRKYGVTVGEVKEANAIEDVDFILAGDSLIIPQ